MDEEEVKEIRTSESIRILRDVGGSHRTREDKIQIQEIQKSSFHREIKCISRFEFEELSNSAGYCFSSYDDEVFIDNENPSDLTRAEVVNERRKRRTSDVIDSVGDTPPKDKTHFFPSDFLDLEGVSRFGSPPITPGSDLGYYSSTCGLASPASLLEYKPAWSRFSSASMDSSAADEKKQDTSFCDQTDADDEADARPNRAPSYSSGSGATGKMPVPRDSQEYNMNHPRRGWAHIFNHDTFKNGMPDRMGSHIDVKDLESTYKLLGFEVEVHNNLDLTSLQITMQKIVDEDYTDCDCLCVTVLTHGQEPNLLYSSDYIYSADSLWQKFTPDRCPTLAAKPKIFFIQACRGKNFDSGVNLVRHTETDSGCDSYKIPKMADFLIAYSTVEGFYSWRNPEYGTWFIQSLCRILRERHDSTDLLRMMTMVSRIVAVEHESYNDTRLDQHAQKQVPSISSTLIRDIYWRAKTNI